MLFDCNMKRTAIRFLIYLLAVVTLTAQSDEVHDPTRPKDFDANTMKSIVKGVSSSQNSLTLQGVMDKKSGKVAIISGQLVAIGDVVSGYKLEKINNDHVVLTKSGKHKRLYVYE